MSDKDDELTTILCQIADALEEHNKIFANHQKDLERLSGEVAAISHQVKELKAGDSSDAKFVADISARMKTILSALKQKP